MKTIQELKDFIEGKDSPELKKMISAHQHKNRWNFVAPHLMLECMERMNLIIEILATFCVESCEGNGDVKKEK